MLDSQVFNGWLNTLPQQHVGTLYVGIATNDGEEARIETDIKQEGDSIITLSFCVMEPTEAGLELCFKVEDFVKEEGVIDRDTIQLTDEKTTSDAIFAKLNEFGCSNNEISNLDVVKLMDLALNSKEFFIKQGVTIASVSV